MPGIVGLVTKMPREQAEAELCLMLETMRHDRGYKTGTWCDQAAGVYVGWACPANAVSETQPISNEQGDAVLLFSGEEFPDPDAIRQLKRRGHRFREDGNSYLVHVYEEERYFPSTLNGRFHGLVADRARGMTTLFNDRFGMNRVYYHQSKDAFYFAAEAKAVLAVCPELRTPDPRSVGEFVACGCVLENRTLFEGLRILPPGSAWVFGDSA